MKSIKVVAAVLQFDGEILCVQRGDHKHSYISKKWEFPGGKIEAGETEREALAREIKEELHVDILVGERLLSVQHVYPDFTLSMACFFCSIESGCVPNIKLTEHVDLRWLSAKSMMFKELDWAAADLPVVHLLHSRSG